MKNLHWSIKAVLIIVPTGFAIWGGYEAYRYYRKLQAERKAPTIKPNTKPYSTVTTPSNPTLG